MKLKDLSYKIASRYIETINPSEYLGDTESALPDFVIMQRDKVLMHHLENTDAESVDLEQKSKFDDLSNLVRFYIQNGNKMKKDSF